MAMFTTIAAGIGLATTAATTAMSFAKAGQMRDDMDAANKAAEAAMEKARKKLDVNVYDKLGINKDVYAQQRDRFSADASALTQAGIEGEERGAAATAGKVLLESNRMQEGITSAMNQDLQQLNMLSAQEASRNRDIGVQLDLEEVAGAQLAAANAQELGAQATAQGMEGLTSLGSQLAEQAPLFEKSASARQTKGIGRTLENKYGQSQAGIQNNMAKLGMVDGVDFSKVGKMSQSEYENFMSKVPAQTLKKIKQNLPNTVQSFSPTYTPPPTKLTGSPVVFPNMGFAWNK